MTQRRITPRWAAALAVLAALPLLLSSDAGAVAHTHHRTHHARLHASSQPGLAAPGRRSQNWSGYVAQGHGAKFTSIEGSWVVPAVDCASTPNGNAAMWVGLDGAGSHTVEQTGTFSQCDHGAASYAAWYEAYPAPSIILPDPVAPGDTLTAHVTNTAPRTFQLVLTNVSKGWTSTNTITVRGRLASAEAIAEAPAVNGQFVPLANFGSVAFSGVSVNGSPLAAAHPIAVSMVSVGGVLKAEPGPLSSDSFSVGWRHT